MATEPDLGTPGKIEFYGGYQVYSESGIDLTQLRENLKRSVTQRLINNCEALKFVQAVSPPRPRQLTIPGEPRAEAGMLQVEGILRQLGSQSVEFVLVGGLAMRAQGSVHITEDIDVCYARTAANQTALAAAMAPIHPHLRGAPPGLPFKLDVPTIQAGLNFTLTTDLGDLDLLGEVSGVGGYEQVLANSDEKLIFGLTIRVLSLDGLVAAKRAAGRLKDRNHLLELEELKKLRDQAG